MSAESFQRVKGKRAPVAGAAPRRPTRRIVAGFLFACAYIGILAGAGFFISSAVNSMSDTTAMARATIAQIRETPPADAVSDTPAPAAAEAAPAAEAPPPAPVADAPPAELAAPPAAAPAPESPRHSSALADLVQSIAAPVGPSAAAVAPAPPSPAPIFPMAAIAAPPAATAPALTRAAAEPAAAPAPPSPAAPVATPASAVADAPTSEFEAQGDERLYQGDLAAARLFYERAAGEGNARAARRLGNSFDPAFLVRWGVRGMRGDPTEAARWYRRASALGDHEAEQDLVALPQH